MADGKRIDVAVDRLGAAHPGLGPDQLTQSANLGIKPISSMDMLLADQP